MRIHCPCCGERFAHEFAYLGAAGPKRPGAHAPEVGEPLDSEGWRAWIDYVYLRDNPAGPHAEYWQHVAGCRLWLEIRRDTRSHAILGVAIAGAP
jgi:sarcosine oxidase subunit delta